ncbi:POTRA domain-containing protein [Botryobacter ruber]|uniref:POTRA domain-containing protein n=1 Tax=Botryobacter ruber TaxID=2171629 RepID=UPI000E0BCBD4|nr:POTRA domain-containing protein [Botryobacter ruber]
MPVIFQRYFFLTAFFSAVLTIVSGAVQAAPCDADSLVVSSINFSGNETTKESVLLYELDFRAGDTLARENLEQRLEENRKRLLNLRLFLEVNVSYNCSDNKIAVLFTLQERFYIYPNLIFDFADRNLSAWLEKKDLRRLDYGVTLVRKNFRGRNEEVRLRLQHGFNRRLELSYKVPYISRKYKLGMEFSVASYKSHTINYNTIENTQRFFLQEEGFPIKRQGIAAGIIHRQSVERQEGFRFAYQEEEISDSAFFLNPDYFRNNLRERHSLRFELFKAVNLRNNFAYPLSGSYFDAVLGQAFFVSDTGKPFTILRSKYVNYQSLGNKFYYAIGAEGQVRFSEQHAFADNVALGYRSLVRGYELYVAGGQYYGLLKQGLTRELFKISGIRLKPIKSAKFNKIPIAMYFNVFADAGYVRDHVYEDTNSFTNTLLAGGGVGLHLVSFYDMVLRLEYTVNRHGDRGFYFSTGFPF